MVIKSNLSPSFLINLFAEFILAYIPTKEKTILQIANCENFWVVKGKTSHQIPLDLVSIKNDFIEKFSHYMSDNLAIKTIDLIEYVADLKPNDEYHFVFYNTESNNFSINQIENFEKDPQKDFNELGKVIDNKNELIYVTEFPFGYSLNMGRSLFYLAKNICYNIPQHIPFSQVSISVPSVKEKFESDFIIKTDYSVEIDESLRSAILDSFDFDTNWLQEEKEKVDQFIEIINPLLEYDFLKRKNPDFLIL